MNRIYSILIEVQKEIGAIKKDSENPFFKSMYFDINSLLGVVKPILNKHGLLLLQGLNNNGSRLVLDTQIVVAESGDMVSFSAILPDGLDAQKQGSAITYFRRYAIVSLLALEAEDDDANSVSDTKKTSMKASYKGTVTVSSSRLATDKQKNYLKELVQKKGLATYTDDELDKMTMDEISKIIDKLQYKQSTYKDNKNNDSNIEQEQ